MTTGKLSRRGFARRAAAAAVASISALAVLSGCAAENAQNSGSAEVAADKVFDIVATTGYLADAIKQIDPEAKIKTLVPPGGDPHTQSLTTQDIQAINAADLVVWTSHDMEHQMMKQFDQLGEKQLPAAESIPEKDLLDWTEDGQVEGHDPHVWNSPDNWIYVVNAIADKLSAMKKSEADSFKVNAARYVGEIEKMRDEAKAKVNAVPKENRILVSGHDAFNYLGRDFGIEIHATDFVSSESEKSASELSEMASLIAEKKVPTIFIDNTTNPEVVKSLQDSVKAKGWDVKISNQELYADTLSSEAPTDTYIGAFRYNIDAIVNAWTA